MDTHVAVVWLDKSHALVARTAEGRPEVVEVDRSFDAEPSYLLRVIHEAASSDRLVVMGPDTARLAFEREYVSLYRRPDRLIDLGQVIDPTRSELRDQLRLLDPLLTPAGA